ncbi:MAG: ABC transporter permease subunit [Ignavibacteriae bacterium]|nr:ABC transporter permease subunit [Ignavibacteria bacterium]MBI3364562.1 ABC transporter permease subunit [Ignavibacteriota bacterium]
MNLNNIKSILRKELRSFFNSPVAYIVIIVYLILLGWFFTSNLFVYNLATLRTVFEMTPFLLLFFAPAMTMRLISEEKKSGTLELLITKPITESEIITGKFLAAWTLYFFTLLPTLSYYITLTILGSLDTGSVIGGYLGLLLVGAVFLAVSVFGSSVTENQVVAFIISLFIVFILFMLDKVLFYLPTSVATILEYISIDYHFSNIARGVIDSRDIIYYASAVGLSLYFATAVLQKRRWA